MEAPTTIIRMKDFMAKKDAGYPEDPAHNVCNSAQDPVMTRARNSACIQIWKLCNSMDKRNSIQQNTTAYKTNTEGPNSLNQDVFGIEVRDIWRGTCARIRMGKGRDESVLCRLGHTGV